MSNYSHLKNQTVFVTGADGFIGSHLVESLAKAGAKVRALAVYNSNNHWGWLEDLPEDLKSNVEIVLGDVRDGDQMAQLVKGCTYVFHLAALIAIPYSYQSPRAYVDTNVTGTLNILQACRENPELKRVIVTSTSEVYGTAQFVPITEEHPLNAQSPYAATKIAADQLAQSFYLSFGLPVIVLRPFNTYGPRQSMRAVLPTLIRQAISSNTLYVGNLKPTRDFNYVLDTVKGFLLASNAPDVALGKVIQVGTQSEVSIEDVITMLGKLLNKQFEVVEESKRLRPEASEVYRLCASIEKAKALLNYTPDETFETGLEKTLNWFRDYYQLADASKVHLYHV